MYYYLYENRDVLVSKTEKEQSGLYEIHTLRRGFAAYCASVVGIYTYLKAFKEQLNETSTVNLGISGRLKQLGYEIDMDYPDKFPIPIELEWCHILFLGIIHGGNIHGYRFLKDFIIPAEYISEISKQYDTNKVENFIKELVQKKFMKFL